MHTTLSNDVQVYKIKKGYRVFFYLMSTIFILGSFFLFTFPFISSREFTSTVITTFYVIGILNLIFWIFAISSTVKSKLEIYDNRIVDKGVFRTKELNIRDISGYRFHVDRNNRQYIIYPKYEKGSKIRIAIGYLDKQTELYGWITGNLTDLDTVDEKREMESILEDENFGMNEEQRRLQLANAKRWTKVLNIGSVVLGVWVLFFPRPYGIAVFTIMLFPLVCYLSIKSFNGLIKFSLKKEKVYPTLDIAVVLPAIALLLRALFDWHPLEWKNFWIPFIVLSLVIWLLAFLFIPDLKKKIPAALVLLIFCLIYGYGSTLILNGVLGTKSYQIYRMAVLDKRISRGSKHTSYYLKLESQYKNIETDDYDVPLFIYNKYNKKDTVVFVRTNGALGIPYYDVY